MKLPGAMEFGSRAERRTILWGAVCGFLVLLLDQATKIRVEKSFILHESRPVITDFFSLTFVHNEGAAWSILAGHGWLLLLIALLVVAGMIRFFRSLTEGYPERYYALCAVLGGVAGNSIDRIFRGAVVDFLDFHWYEVYHYPVFNVADIAICVGIGLFILSSLLRPSRKREKEPVTGTDK